MPEGVSSCRFVKKYPERKRDRILSDDECRRLATALGAPSAGSFALAVATAATRLSILAECGNGEVLVIRRRNLTPRIKGSQQVSSPIGVETASRITPKDDQTDNHA